MSFDDIPEDLACEILSRITDPGDRVRLAAVSRVFRDAEKAGVASLPGSPSALVELGRGFQRIASVEKAFYWWRKVADHADARAMHEIAMCYYYGWGVKQDHTKAFELWERASERGHADATHCLATSYELGLGVKVNETKGMELHVKAVELGSKDAAYYLGNVYLRNVRPPTGVALNKKEALKWFRVAVELGCNRSVYWMTGLEAELAATQTNTQNFESFDEDESMTESLS